MHRQWIAVVAIALVAFIGAPATAGVGARHIEVDDTVTQGSRLGIAMIECVSLQAVAADSSR